MSKTIDFSTYLDKVKGCFLGKTVIGTLGAPYEGVKMPMELPYKPEMINTMLPNDDLDLQVLWLDVAEKYGADLTSQMLQKAFVENCDYSPGEYAIMRKNHEKGIYPPFSGSFCNDFYIEGMGCPIRSEIWACLAPGNPYAAADFASRDGILDHKGESVYAERFFAAMESAAFFENDLYKLIEAGFSVIPDDCKFKGLVKDVMSYCNEYNDIKEVLSLIIFKYGHPDCTNMFQNMGIVIACLIFGEYDMIKTGMMALNCGFDTDCTCASAGALIGIILGEQEIQKLYAWGDIKYVLGVRSNRRSDRVADLSEDIALLGAEFSKDIPNGIVITNAPQKEYSFVSTPAITICADYEDGDPSIGLGRDSIVNLTITNNSDEIIEYKEYKFITPENINVSIISSSISEKGFSIAGKSKVLIKASFSLDDKTEIIYEKNLIRFILNACNEAKNSEYIFGLSGNKLWKMTGPIWKTFPATDEKVLGSKIGYWQVFSSSRSLAEETDKVRFFHLNFDTDADTDFFSDEELFAPLGGQDVRLSKGGETLFARPYVEKLVEIREDAIKFDDLMGFKGPCVIYLSQILISPEERDVDIQLGYSGPFKLFINGELIGDKNRFDQWTSENSHFEKIHLNKGENKVVLRLTRSNNDGKFSLIFSQGMSCATHFCDLATKRI